DQIQKLRVAEGNRVYAASAANDEKRKATHSRYYDQLESLESAITKQVQHEMREHPAWPWLEKIRGVGEVAAASVVAYVDITRVNSVSGMWRWAGYALKEQPCKACEGKGFGSE